MKLEYVKASVTILSPGWNNARSEMVSAFCVPAVKIIWSQEASTWKVDKMCIRDSIYREFCIQIF